MLRETTFVLGGGVTVGLGVLLGAGLALSGAGLEFFSAWVAAGIAVGFGLFFIHVGRAEGRERRRALRALEAGEAEVPRRS